MARDRPKSAMKLPLVQALARTGGAWSPWCPIAFAPSRALLLLNKSTNSACTEFVACTNSIHRLWVARGELIIMQARCCMCDRAADEVATCKLCKSVRFCGKECEDAATEKGHASRCPEIRSFPEPSQALKKMMLDDYVLEEAALKMFSSPNWLGDENIEFFWEQIARDLNPTCKALDILFVPPAVVMLAHFLTAEQLREPDNFGKNLGDIKKMQLVIMAINNAELGQDSGTHWGCLVYCRSLNQFRYYDSMRGANTRLARAFAKKFSVALEAEDAQFVEEVEAPQQRNSYDCGVFAMIVGEVIARHFHATGCLPTTADIASRVLSDSRVIETRRAAAKQASSVRSRCASRPQAPDA